MAMNGYKNDEDDDYAVDDDDDDCDEAADNKVDCHLKSKVRDQRQVNRSGEVRGRTKYIPDPKKVINAEPRQMCNYN